jgi:hypothetical protein
VTIYLKCYISTTQIKIPQCRSTAPKHKVNFGSKCAAEVLAWSSPNVRPKKTRSRWPAQSFGKINKLATYLTSGEQQLTMVFLGVLFVKRVALIQTHLDGHPQLKDDPKFAGLYSRVTRGQKRMHTTCTMDKNTAPADSLERSALRHRLNDSESSMGWPASSFATPIPNEGSEFRVMDTSINHSLPRTIYLAHIINLSYTLS